jgi:hypothetical protein
MAAIPVIADACIFYRPVPTQTDKDIFAVIIRIDISERPAWSPIIVHREVVFRPDGSVAYAVMAVKVYVLMVTAMPYHLRTVVIYHM